MAYCRKCGAEIFDEAVICPKCGVPTNDIQVNTNVVATPVEQTTGTTGIILGVLIPIGGVIAGIYYLSNGDKTAARNTFIASAVTFVIAFTILSMI